MAAIRQRVAGSAGRRSVQPTVQQGAWQQQQAKPLAGMLALPPERGALRTAATLLRLILLRLHWLDWLQVAAAATEAMLAACGTAGNRDLEPHIPALVCVKFLVLYSCAGA